MLTVFRHFDSASVHKGVLGDLPKTLWVLDYPLLERIYYALVAGFDVYGTAGHQLAIRLYMDRLRIEGESHFLDYLPAEKRREIMQSWYIDVDLEKIHYHPGRDAGEDPLRDGRPETRIHGAPGQGAPVARDGDRVRPDQLRADRSAVVGPPGEVRDAGGLPAGARASSPSPGRRSSR